MKWSSGDVAEPAAWAGRRTSTPSSTSRPRPAPGSRCTRQDRYHRVNVEGTRLAGEFAARKGPAGVVELAGGVRRRHAQPAVLRGRPPPAGVVLRRDQVAGRGRARRHGRAGRRHDHPAAERHRPRPGPAQPLHRCAGRVPRDAPRRQAADGVRRRQPDPRLHPRPGPGCADRVVPRAPGRDRAAPDPQLRDRVRTTLLELAAYAIEGSPHDDVPIEHLDVHRAGDIDHACASLDRLREVGAPRPSGRREKQSSTSSAGRGTSRAPRHRPGTPRSTSWPRADYRTDRDHG